MTVLDSLDSESYVMKSSGLLAQPPWRVIPSATAKQEETTSLKVLFAFALTFLDHEEAFLSHLSGSDPFQRCRTAMTSIVHDPLAFQV